MLKRVGWTVALSFAAMLAGCNSDYGLDQYGQAVTARALQKHWLVVNYWASWCGPCRKEIPQLNRLAEQLAGANVRVIGVNFDNLQGDDLRSASEALGIHYTVLAENPAARFDLPENDALPITYLIDPQGKVREQLMGEQTARGIMAKLKEAGAL